MTSRHSPAEMQIPRLPPVRLLGGNKTSSPASHHSLKPRSVALRGILGCVLTAMLAVQSSAAHGSSAQESASVPLGSQISGRERRAWVSPDGVFSLGFLGDYQKDGGLVVGIWHNLRRSAEKVPVWTVGGGVRVSQNSSFQLSLDGSLELYDGTPGGLPVWSSDTGGSGVRAALLMNDGNLVLFGFEETIVWESFDSPTDTLLPGQSLRFPRSLRAHSTNSVASYYSLRINSSGELSLVWENNVTYWSSEHNFSVAAVEARLEDDGLFGLFGADGSLAWYRLSEDFREPSVELRRLRIDSDGNLRMYSWDDASSAWKVGWQAVQNQCDVFGSCGLDSVCGYSSGGPACECLSEDSISHECEKLADLGNCDTGLSMSVLQKTVLYSLYPPHDVDIMLSSEACQDYCLNDSSCFAATALNDGSGLCTIKRTSFISGYRYASVHATSFLKVCLVPEAVSAQAAKLHGDAWMPLPAESSSSGIIEQKNVMGAVAILLLITAFAFVTAEMFVFWFVWYRRRKINNERRIAFVKDVQMNPHYSAVVRLSGEEVEKLTRNFVNKLGPSVYRGILPNKLPVTVKVLDNVVASEREFQMVVSNLGSTYHRNLVALKGFCYEPKRKLLLYEYVKNGSLHQWLLKRKHSKGRDNWHQRLNIAIGIARGLAYLHLECKQCIAHGNLKLENILLDEHFVAKLTEFGLHVLLDRDVVSSSETLPEKDVYMFGGILLQIVAGKKDGVENRLCDLAYKVAENGALSGFVDVHLEGRVEQEGVVRVVKLALWCMQNQPSLRPSIGEIVMVLEGALSLDMPPIPQASVVSERLTAEDNSDRIKIFGI